MALVRTTLSSACGAGDNSIVVASATGFAAGYRIQIDQEVMRVDTSYSSGTTIPVIRGVDASCVAAHVATAGVVCGVGTDFPDPQPQTETLTKISGRVRQIQSYSAAATITPPADGSDLTVVINGTSVVALTIAVPTKDMDGCELNIVSNGAAAHTLTFTGGLSGAGTSYDVITINATAPAAFKFIACNSLWMAYCQPPMGGTVTNIIGSVA